MIQTFDFSYPSSDNIHTVHAREWVPEGAPRGVVQLVHGVAEYAGRYDHFARYLADHGFVVCGEDHLGHGLTAGGKFGYFGPKNGWDLVARDIRRLRDLEGEKFTLSVTQLMLGQTVTETVLPVEWGNLPRDHAAMRRRVSQRGWTDGYKPAAFEDGTALLLQPGSLDLPAAPGVTLTAAGFLEDQLRLQLRFDGHSPYDREALTLTAPDGTAYRACAFIYTPPEEGTVYRDAVYDVTPEALADCVLAGRFATGGQMLQGDWQVTFRLDS